MDITPDLLLRYYKGEVTPSERQAVAAWLVRSPLEEPIPDAWAATDTRPAQEEQVVRATIWDAVQRSTETGPTAAGTGRVVSLHSYAQLASVLAAACVVLWLGYGWLTGLTQTSIIDTRNQVVARTTWINHLKLVVQPHSRCIVTRSTLEGNMLVRFQGAIAITPEAGSYTAEKLTIECTDSHKKDWLRLPPGKTFLAMTDNVYQLITATTDELNDDIPRPFSARLVSRFAL